MNTTAQTHDNGTYYVRNTITGLYWNGLDFSAPDNNGDLSAAKTVPGSALPIMRATWLNIEPVVTAGLLSKKAAKEATAAATRAADELRRKAADERRAQERAARREQNRKADAEKLATLRTTAEKLAASADHRQASIGNAWLNAMAALEERAERMLANPSYYFEWAAVDMENAANADLYASVIARVAKGDDFDTTLKNAIEGVKVALLDNRWRSNSTSAAHNAMQEAMREAASRFVRYAGVM